MSTVPKAETSVDLRQLCEQAKAGDPESIRQMFCRPLNCPFRQAWVGSTVTSVREVLREPVSAVFSRWFPYEFENRVEEFWSEVSTTLGSRNVPTPRWALPDAILDKTRLHKYLLGWARNVARKTVVEDIRQRTHESNSEQRLSIFKATVTAFFSVLKTPPPPRHQPLAPPALVVYFSSDICDTYGATSLATTECNLPLKVLADLAAQKSPWCQDYGDAAGFIQAVLSSLYSTLSQPTSNGVLWNDLTIDACLQGAAEPGDAIEVSQEAVRRRRIVDQWLEGVRNRVRDHQKPGTNAQKIIRLYNSNRIFQDRLRYINEQPAEDHPVAVLTWALVYVVKYCKQEDLACIRFLTWSQAVEELCGRLRQRNISLSPHVEAWLRKNVIAGTVGDEVVRLNIDLDHEVAHQENCARGKRNRWHLKSGER